MLLPAVHIARLKRLEKAVPLQDVYMGEFEKKALNNRGLFRKILLVRSLVHLTDKPC